LLLKNFYISISHVFFLLSGRTTCADFSSDNDGGSENFNPVIIEQYSPAKYSFKNAEFFGSQFTHQHLKRKTSASSQTDYQVFISFIT